MCHILHMAVFDSHFHLLTMKKKGLDIHLDEDITGIDVGTDLNDIVERRPLIAPYRKLQYSQGIGPWALDDAGFPETDRACCLLEEDLKKHGGAFIGECGLDYHWMYGTKEAQIGLFLAQIELSRSLGLPLIIHSRDADDDMEKIIRSCDFPYGGIMHCFSSGWSLAKKALDKGLMVSFSGNVTYKANTEIRDAAEKTPSDRILYETDSPYLAPVPFRGRPSNPCMTENTSAFLASVRNTDVAAFRTQVLDNFNLLLSLSSNRKE